MHIALFCLLILISLLLSPPASQAITITTDSDTNLGTLKSGESLSLTLQADDYTAESVSKITWTVKANSKYNPGFTLSPKKGTSVTLKAKSLKSLKSTGTTDGTFSVTVTVRDTDATTNSITFTGKVFDAPVIKTTSLPKATADTSKIYNAKLEISAGSEPLNWTINGDIPSGLSLTKGTGSGINTYYLISGYPDVPGTYPIELTVSNDVGTASKKFTLEVAAVKPKITVPSGFSNTYAFKEGDTFEIDLSKLTITGTKPFTIDIDEISKSAGLSYDDSAKVIRGNITNAPSNGKLKVNVEVRNSYTQSSAGGNKPVTLALNINVLTPPDDIKIKSSNFNVYAEYGDCIDGYVTMNKNFKMTFTAGKGSKPIKWEFICPDVGYDNRRIMKYLGGKLNDFTFSSNGTISGTPKKDFGFYIWVYADNDAVDRTDGYNGYNRVKEIGIWCGLPPEFNTKAASEAVILKNGTSVDISLDDFFNNTMGWNSSVKYTATSKFPAGLNLEDGKITGTLNIENQRDIKKYMINLTAENAFGKSTGKITLDIQDVPGRIYAGYTTAAPVKKGGHYISEGEDDYELTSFCPAVLGKSFNMKFTTETGNNVKWDFILENMGSEYNGKSVIKDLGGKLGGLTFKDDGTISGTPAKDSKLTGRYVIYIRAIASNSVGSLRSKGVIEINGGLPLEFDQKALSETIVLKNGTSVDIFLDDFLTKNSKEYPPNEYTVTGNLPSGLNLENGKITGTLNITDQKDLKKYTINLTAESLYGKAKGKITFDIQDSPGGITAEYTTAAPVKKGSYYLSEEESYYTEKELICPAVIGKNFKMKFTAETGNKLKWQFIREDDNTDIIKDLKGKLGGLIFKDDGTISGTPVKDSKLKESYVINVRAIAYNSVDSVRANGVIKICGGVPPAFNAKATSEPIVLSDTGVIHSSKYVTVSSSDETGYTIYFDGFMDFSGYDYSYEPNGYFWTDEFTYTGTLPPDMEFYGTGKYDENGIMTESPRIEGKLNINDSKDFKKYKINLTASNMYGTAKGTITLDVQSSPAGITPMRNYSNQDFFNEKKSPVKQAVPYYATIGENYSGKITASGNKPITWDYVIVGIGGQDYYDSDKGGYDQYLGKKIIKDLGGTINGLTFSGDGTIKGTPKMPVSSRYPIRYHTPFIAFRAVASNNVGSSESDVFCIMFGTKPKLKATTNPVTLTNGKVSFDLDEYFEWDSGGYMCDHYSVQNSSINSHPWGGYKLWRNSNDEVLDSNNKLYFFLNPEITIWETSSQLPSGLTLGVYSPHEDGAGKSFYASKIDPKEYYRYEYANNSAGTYIYYWRGMISGDIKITDKKDFKKYTINLTATNPFGSAKAKLVFNVVAPTENVSSGAPLELKYLPQNRYSLPDYEEADDSNMTVSDDTESEDDTKVLRIIHERDESDLNAFSLGHVSNDVYVIAAVLPELEVKEDGQYDIDVLIDENIRAGAKLYWFAFPKDKESSDDDEIAEFYDESGKEIESVPESRNITVSAWFNEGVIYEPVIAVKRRK